MPPQITVLAIVADPISPPVSVHTLLTGWQTDWSALAALAVDLAAVALYIAGTRRLAAKGRHWPRLRTASFVAGIALVVVAVNSGLAAYDDSVFAMHTLQHLLLMNVAPIFLALGAPTTLALQAARRPFQQGLLRVLHSRPFQILTFPVLVAALTYGIMLGYFLTPFYAFSLHHQLVHDLTHVVFLVAGCLYWWPVVGLDPSHWRLSFQARLAYLASGIPVTAILGLALTGSPTSVAPGIHSVADTHAGGSVLWVAGELITFAALAVVLVQFMKADERQAARNDRRLDHEAANAAREVEWAALADQHSKGEHP